jgi:hypothetical protein
MERVKAVRVLKIAWSVACGIVCALLVVLWMRSYWRADESRLRYSNHRGIGILSIAGRLDIDSWYFEDATINMPSMVFSKPISQLLLDTFVVDQPKFKYGTRTQRGVTFISVTMPHYFLVGLAAALTAAP